MKCELMDNPKSSFLRSWKSVFLVSVHVVVLVLASYALFSNLPRKTALSRVVVVSQSLEFSMELNKTTFVQGEDIFVDLHLKNVGNETVFLSWGSGIAVGDEQLNQHMHFDFLVVDASNLTMHRDRFYKGQVLNEYLNPREELVNLYIWHSWEQTVYPSGPKIPKGVYFVKGLTRPMSVGTSHGWIEMSLETPPIGIVVT